MNAQLLARFSHLRAAPLTLQRTCVHEAGHGVTACLLNVPIKSLELHDSGRAAGEMKLADQEISEMTDQIAVVAMAGVAAAFVFDPDNVSPNAGANDRRIVRRLIRHRLDLLFPAGRDEFFLAAQLHALQIVTQNFFTVLALADQLAAKRTLNGEAVVAFVREHLQKDQNQRVQAQEIK